MEVRRLLDQRGVAALLGVERSTPHTWRQRGNLPKPDIDDFPDKPLWLLSTIVNWAKDSGRWPPRPRPTKPTPAVSSRSVAPPGI